jgi:hypothetical protein
VTTRYTDPILVQIATSLPAAESGWQDSRYTRALQATDGLAPLVGEATLETHYGEVLEDGTLVEVPRAAAPPLGWLVRLSHDTRGRLRDLGAATPFWWGIVDHQDIEPDRRCVRSYCLSLQALLGRIALTRGWELVADAVVDPGEMLPFNAFSSGDRSESPDGDTYVHDRVTLGSRWSAAEIAEMILLRGTTVGWCCVVAPSLTWAISTDGITDYDPGTIDLSGKSIAEALSALFPRSRGMSWYITVSGDTATVVAVDLADWGGATPQTLDGPEIQDLSIIEGGGGVDLAVIYGARPLIGMTLEWNPLDPYCALIPDGWEPGEEADAALDAAEDLAAESPTPPVYDAPAWRRFKINPDWNGTQYGSSSTGLRSYVDGDYTLPDGTRAHLSQIPAVTALTLERITPWGEQFATGAHDQRQAPVVCAGVAGEFEDLSETCRPTPISAEGPGDSQQVQSGLTLGDTIDAARALHDAIGEDGTLVVTIGIREWHPLCVAWLKDRDRWPGPHPRVLRIDQPRLEQWIGLSGSVTGVDEDGLLTLTGSDATIRDDTARLTDLAAQVGARWNLDRGSATWTDRGRIDCAPDWGSLISSITDQYGEVFYPQANLVKVTWWFDRERYGTGYEAIPILSTEVPIVDGR